MALHLYYAFGLGMTMTLLSCSLSFPEYSFKVFPVHNCPMNKEAWDKSSDRLKCNKTHGYHCVPNRQLTALIEFCYPRGEKILFQEGNCLELAGSGILNHVPCRKILSTGCPDNFYFGNEIYKYPTCLAINTTLGCFVGDLQCINSSLALKYNVSEQSSTTEPMRKSTNNNSKDSVLLLIDLTTSRQNSTTEPMTNSSDINLSSLLIENNTFYKNSTIEETASLTNSENSIVTLIVLAILLFVTTASLVLVIFKRNTIKHGISKCLRKCKLGSTDINKDNCHNHIMEEGVPIYKNPETINYSRDENGELYYAEPDEFYSVYTYDVEKYLEPEPRRKTVKDDKLSSVSDDGTVFEAYLNENQLNEVKSCTNHPDENTSADSNQILTIDLYNNHPEDADIYEMEPELEARNVESCTCTDHTDENTRVNSKTIKILDDSQNNHSELSSTPFNNGHSDNSDKIEPTPKPRLRYVEVVIDNPKEKTDADSNKIKITIDSQNIQPEHDDTSYSPDEIDQQHKTNCSHGQHLPQEQPAREKDVCMHHHYSDVHTDDRKQTLKNNIQSHPSEDSNNDHTERTNEENISVSIEDTFEIVDVPDKDTTDPEHATGCVIA